jgi:hypothetical protein
MKNITRLALAFAVATIACLSPLAHAEDEAQLVGSGIQPERHYKLRVLSDPPGISSTMVVKDGPKSNGRRPIYVTVDSGAYTFSGQGWRSLASEQTHWFAYCEFRVSSSELGSSLKVKGYIPVKPGYGTGGGYFYLTGSGSPYSWECYFDD